MKGIPDSLLDNLGTRLNVSELPGASEYRIARDSLFGKGRVGRFWCKHVRPWLFPLRQQVARQRFMVAQRIIRREMINAVFEKALGEKISMNGAFGLMDTAMMFDMGMEEE